MKKSLTFMEIQEGWLLRTVWGEVGVVVVSPKQANIKADQSVHGLVKIDVLNKKYDSNEYEKNTGELWIRPDDVSMVWPGYVIEK